MFQIISVIVIIISAILAFTVGSICSWLPILIVDVFFGVTLFAGMKYYKFKWIKEISADANILIQKYPLYFAMPYGSKDFGASASTLALGGIALVVVNIIKGFWISLAFGIINWVIMGFFASAFNPFIGKRDPERDTYHNEAMNFLQSRADRPKYNKVRPKAPTSTMTLKEAGNIIDIVQSAMEGKEVYDLQFHPACRLKGYDMIHIDTALKLRLATEFLILSGMDRSEREFAEGIKLYSSIPWTILTNFVDDDKFEQLIALDPGSASYRRYLIEIMPEPIDSDGKFKDNRLRNLETMESFGGFCKNIGVGDPNYWEKIYHRIGLEYTSESPRGNCPQ
jgi:hypothetical protein